MKRMPRINPVNLLGVVLVLAGLIGPWFNFNLPIIYGEGPAMNAMVHCYMSPFTVSINLTSTSELTIYTDIGVIGYGTSYFYSEKAALIGFLCILGVALSLIGEYKNRSKVTFAAGLLVLVSTLAFFLLVPDYVFQEKWVLMWGFWLSIAGSIFLLISIAVRILILRWEYDDVREL